MNTNKHGYEGAEIALGPTPASRSVPPPTNGGGRAQLALRCDVRHYQLPANGTLLVCVLMVVLRRQRVSLGRGDLAATANTAIDARIWGRGTCRMDLVECLVVRPLQPIRVLIKSHARFAFCPRLSGRLDVPIQHVGTLPLLRLLTEGVETPRLVAA